MQLAITVVCGHLGRAWQQVEEFWNREVEKEIKKGDQRHFLTRNDDRHNVARRQTAQATREKIILNQKRRQPLKIRSRTNI